MKAIAVFGSARADGNSSKVMYEIIRGINDNKNDVKIININDIDLKGCQGCRSCREMNCDCVIKDGLEDYFNELHTADVLIVSAPNFFSTISGQMIEFMNRHYCMSDDNKNSRLEHTVKLVAVFSQGAPESYKKYEDTYNWYINVFKTKGFDVVKKIVVGGDSDLSQSGNILQDAYKLGKNL